VLCCGLGAIILSKYLEKKFGGGKVVEEFKGKNVLEIGSGTGVGGIGTMLYLLSIMLTIFKGLTGLLYKLVCAHFWKGANFVLTDQEQVLQLINENIKRNMDLIPALKTVRMLESVLFFFFFFVFVFFLTLVRGTECHHRTTRLGTKCITSHTPATIRLGHCLRMRSPDIPSRPSASNASRCHRYPHNDIDEL
jgi:quinol-cytochrome oxidoreductase complex cytochrome b subunit